MKIALTLNEFFVEGGSQDESHVLLHVTEPTEKEETSKGYFFAVCELNNAEPKHIMRLQNIIDEAENGYYETADTVEKTALEIVLERANSDGYPLINDAAKLSCVVGVARGTDIIFSYYGNPIINLFYQKQDGEYAVADLIESSPAGNNKQLFGQIIEGKIKPGDYLFLGTPSITEYFDTKRLEKIITTRPVRQSIDHIENTLRELKNELSFGGTILRVEEIENTGKLLSKQRNAPAKSDIFSAEKKTAQILKSPFFPQIKKADKPNEYEQNEYPAKQDIRRPVGANSNTKTENKQKIQNDVIIKFLNSFGKILLQLGVWLINLIISLFTFLFRQVAFIFLVTTNYHGRRRNILEQWGRNWRSHKENFKQLSRSTKILMLFSILVAVAFVASLILIRVKQREQMALQNHKNSITDIRSRIDNMEGAIIYNNEGAILNEINSVKQMMGNLDCKKYPEDCENLNLGLDKFIAKISKITVINPEKILGKELLSTDYDNITKIGNKLLITGKSTSTIGIFDILSKDLKTVVLNTNGIIDGNSPKENDYSLLLGNDGKLFKFDPKDSSFKEIEISYPGNNYKIVSIFIYNRKLYSLDASAGTVYRHTPIQSGFGKGTPWSDQNITSLNNAVSMAIDGDLYALSKNGGITKLSQGKTVSFNVNQLFPPLQAGDKIWTYNNLKHIYILDGEQKRLIIINPDGSFYKQLTADEFISPKSMIIDEPTRVGYILDKGALYKTDLP